MNVVGKSVVEKGSSGSGAAATFNKDELTAILKFGAEELFNQAEEEDDEEPKVDIDEILKRAETREGDQSCLSGATEELLSQFKVCDCFRWFFLRASFSNVNFLTLQILPSLMILASVTVTVSL